jgi:hypothetical protein
MSSTVSRKYPLDPHPELHGASSRALNAHESMDGNSPGYVGPTRSTSFPTEVNNVVTRFVLLRVVLRGIAVFGRGVGKTSSARHVVDARLAPRGGEVPVMGCGTGPCQVSCGGTPRRAWGLAPGAPRRRAGGRNPIMAISRVIAWGPHRCPWDRVEPVKRLPWLPTLMCQLWGKSSGVAWTISWRMMAALET